LPHLMRIREVHRSADQKVECVQMDNADPQQAGAGMQGVSDSGTQAAQQQLSQTARSSSEP